MALHPLTLPKSAALLFRIVILQKRLLKALADPGLVASEVNTAWVQAIWRNMDAEWVRQFCLRGQEDRIKTIAAATPAARAALHQEFCCQNKVPSMLQAGGNFLDLSALPGFDVALAKTVTEFFKECYDLLGQASRTKGYAFSPTRVVTKSYYKRSFYDANLAVTVCPYCDGDLGTPELDHYYSKTHFPLLSCSPWNLVPVCKSCNDTTIAKGERLALSPGPPRSTGAWLHPFKLPGSNAVRIQLTGDPKQTIPKLHSPDVNEQHRLDNHLWLLDRLDQTPPSLYLSNRWTKVATAYFDVLVRKVSRNKSGARLLDHIMQEQLEDHQDARGRTASSLVHMAVCQAVLDRRPEYLAEFADPNPPALA